MGKNDTLAFAHQLAKSDVETCGAVVQSLMLTRGLSKLVRALDELALDPRHQNVAQSALRNIGFTD